MFWYLGRFYNMFEALDPQHRNPRQKILRFIRSNQHFMISASFRDCLLDLWLSLNQNVDLETFCFISLYRECYFRNPDQKSFKFSVLLSKIIVWCEFHVFSMIFNDFYGFQCSQCRQYIQCIHCKLYTMYTMYTMNTMYIMYTKCFLSYCVNSTQLI